MNRQLYFGVLSFWLPLTLLLTANNIICSSVYGLCSPQAETAIGEKYQKFRLLGPQIHRNPEQGGRCEGLFKYGAIYYIPGKGANEIHGGIWEKWKQLGGMESTLGWPISDETKGVRDSRLNFFENGTIRMTVNEFDRLTFLTQNMALLVAPASYSGQSREAAIGQLIYEVNKLKPDFVGLQEVFADGERERIRSGLRNLYPYYVEGPDERDAHSDGGLLLLSQHKLLRKGGSIFRSSVGEDSLSNKGVVFAIIAPTKEHPGYCVFNTHLQNNKPDYAFPVDGDKARNKQIEHIASFVNAVRPAHDPAILMGDFNFDGTGERAQSKFLAMLDNPMDIWKESADKTLGITSDRKSSFHPGSPTRGVSSSERHKDGQRLDYLLHYPSESMEADWSNARVHVWQLPGRTHTPGRDISDHYGLSATQTLSRSFEVQYNDDVEIRIIGADIIKIHCLQTTDGPGKDDMSFHLFLSGADTHQTSGSPWTREKEYCAGTISTGESLASAGWADPGDFLEVMVRGKEIDDMFSKDEFLGPASLQVRRADLLNIKGKNKTLIRTMPLLMGYGGVYVLTVKIWVK